MTRCKLVIFSGGTEYVIAEDLTLAEAAELCEVSKWTYVSMNELAYDMYIRKQDDE